MSMNGQSHYLRNRVSRITRISQGAFLAVMVATIFFASALSAQAVYVKDHPVKITQPDGTVLNLLITGDEYFRYTHTSNGTIIAQDLDGYATYAQLNSKGKISPSSKRVTKSNMASYTGLKPNQVSPEKNITNKSMKEENEKRQVPQLSPSGKRISSDSKPLINSGSITNIVIYIRFADEYEFVTPSVISSNQGLYNTNTISVKSAIEAQSEGACSVSSVFAHDSSNNIVSYQSAHSRSYYMPYSYDNPGGYWGEEERAIREQDLLSDAATWADSLGTLPSGSHLDMDDDGYLDSVTFIVSGDAMGWNDLLWPHMWATDNDHNPEINGKIMYQFDFQLEEFEDVKSDAVGTYTHEMMHMLGFPDLYRYYMNGTPVGSWDVMASAATVPQYASAFMRYIVAGWGKAPEELTSLDQEVSVERPGTNGSSPTSYYRKMVNGGWLVFEYRKQISGSWDQSLPSSGLLIYRVEYPYSALYPGDFDYGNSETEWYGDGFYNPDSYYIYRPGVESIFTDDGTIPWYITAGDGSYYNQGGVPESAWALSSSLSRPTYGKGTTKQNALFYSNGRNSYYYAYDIGSNAGNSISFKLGKRKAVSFKSNGETVAPTQYILAGNCATRPDNPTRHGYKFTGWYTDEAKTQKYDFSQPVNNSFTLYAGWTSTSCYVTKISKSTGSWNKTWSRYRYSPSYTTLTIGRTKSYVKIRPYISSKAKVYARYAGGSWSRITSTKTIKVSRGKSKTLYMKCVSQAGNYRLYKLVVKRNK